MTDLLFKLLDLILSGYLSKRKDKKTLSNKFYSLKRQIKYTAIANELPSKLNKLRVFIIESNLIKQPNIKTFYEKWLNDPIVASGVYASNVYSKKDIELLQSELDLLRLL